MLKTLVNNPELVKEKLLRIYEFAVEDYENYINGSKPHMTYSNCLVLFKDGSLEIFEKKKPEDKLPIPKNTEFILVKEVCVAKNNIEKQDIEFLMKRFDIVFKQTLENTIRELIIDDIWDCLWNQVLKDLIKE